jgi:nucleoside-diphosphate-sugar epimerase
MNICITGGAGYVGSALVPYLIRKGHTVTVLDTFWFGDHLPNHPNLFKVKGDIRNRSDLLDAFTRQDAVIHLACISNDPSFDLNPSLGRSINYSCFQDILSALQECNIKRFIYASSSSVYGISDLKNVTEDAPKNPLTDYSKYKLACEKELRDYGTGGAWTIIRPATVCGYAPRLRLDLVVNILTMHALKNKKIIIHGRNQKRPNIHIEDMVRAYDYILSCDPDFTHGETFNVGFENKSLLELAELVRGVCGENVEIVEEPTRDPRSYHINSDKIIKFGFEPKKSIKNAVTTLKQAARRGLIINPFTNPIYHNILKAKELDLK